MSRYYREQKANVEGGRQAQRSALGDSLGDAITRARKAVAALPAFDLTQKALDALSARAPEDAAFFPGYAFVRVRGPTLKSLSRYPSLLVRSYVASKDERVGTATVKAGTNVHVVACADDAVWASIKRTSFGSAGLAARKSPRYRAPGTPRLAGESA